MTQPARRLRTIPALPPRRLQIMRLAARGLTNREIGAALHLSADTVKTHLRHAFKQLRARNRQHAIALCLTYGLIEVRELRPFSLPPGPVSAAAVRWAA